MSFQQQSRPIRNMSLFIPHVFVKHHNMGFVASVFEKLAIGKVKVVEQIPNYKNNYISHYDICVYFDYWYDNTATRNLQNKIISKSNKAKIVYDDPWYWTVYENGVMKTDNDETEEELLQKPKRSYERKTIICLDEDRQKNFEKYVLTMDETENILKQYRINKNFLEKGEIIEEIDGNNLVVV